MTRGLASALLLATLLSACHGPPGAPRGGPDPDLNHAPGTPTGPAVPLSSHPPGDNNSPLNCHIDGPATVCNR